MPITCPCSTLSLSAFLAWLGCALNDCSLLLSHLHSLTSIQRCAPKIIHLVTLMMPCLPHLLIPYPGFVSAPGTFGTLCASLSLCLFLERSHPVTLTHLLPPPSIIENPLFPQMTPPISSHCLLCLELPPGTSLCDHLPYFLSKSLLQIHLFQEAFGSSTHWSLTLWPIQSTCN